MADALRQEVESKLDTLLADMRKIGSEQGKLQRQAGSLNKEQQAALKSLRKTYVESAKEAEKLERLTSKNAQAQRHAARQHQQVRQEVTKGGKAAQQTAGAMGSIGPMLQRGLTGASGALATVLVQLSRMLKISQEVARSQANIGQRNRGMSERVVNVLEMAGISGGGEQQSFLSRFQRIGGPVTEEELVSFMESLPMASLGADDTITLLEQYARSGGKSGLFGGDSAKALGQMRMFLQDRTAADAADVALSFLQATGRQGFTAESFNKAQRLVPAMGGDRLQALALTSLFTRAGQGEGISALSSEMARGTSLQDVLAGRVQSNELRASIAAVRGTVRMPLDQALQWQTHEFRRAAGGDYVGQQVADLPREVTEARAVRSYAREMEIKKRVRRRSMRGEIEKIAVDEYFDELQKKLQNGEISPEKYALLVEQREKYTDAYVMKQNKIQAPRLIDIERNMSSAELIRRQRFEAMSADVRSGSGGGDAGPDFGISESLRARIDQRAEQEDITSGLRKPQEVRIISDDSRRMTPAMIEEGF